MKKLIILEMANNHSGLIDHGKKIIDAYSKICSIYLKKYEFVFKFQYRDLATFIRKDMREDLTIPLIKRFSETKLKNEEFLELIKHCRKSNFGVMVTPFDEISVDTACEHNVDYLKIASCSFGDWPLMEKISEYNKKVVASCAGANLQTIDNVVSFFLNRGISLRLQHCVGEYPTNNKDLNVNQVLYLKNKYPSLDIGFSSHENPDMTSIAPLALALGATSFEKHVALETSKIKKNAYSTSPDQFINWLKSLDEASVILGDCKNRYTPSIKESESLRNLQRGVFTKRNLINGQILSYNDIYFAFPPSKNQLTANDFSKYSKFIVNSNIAKNEPILMNDVTEENIRVEIREIVQNICEIINKSNLVVPPDVDLEISHHYGIKKFKEFGLSMLTIVNREYCKKILILLPGQSHPEQYHKNKEETFNVLWGEGILRINDEKFSLHAGIVHTILPKQRHYFETQNGIIIEEISSTHFENDSFYTDKEIMANKDRKTLLTHWRIS